MASPAIVEAIAQAAAFFTDKYALIDQADSNTVYYGFPELDPANDNDPNCAIAKMSTSGNVTTIKWSNGSSQKTT